jgi:uncharacterized lipoprotein YmbA
MRLMMRNSSRLLAAAVLGVIIGCASSPPTRFYRLTPEAVPSATNSTRAVIIGPFQLADYLDRPQIVTRGSSNAVTVADFERWAEPLDANFQGVVAANVSRLLGSERVLEFPAQAIMEPERRVTGRISQFDVDTEGLAVLEVQWGVLDGDGAMSQPARRSRYEVPAAGNSYAARVAALNSAVARFSEDVAAAVR